MHKIEIHKGRIRSNDDYDNDHDSEYAPMILMMYGSKQIEAFTVSVPVSPCGPGVVCPNTASLITHGNEIA